MDNNIIKALKNLDVSSLTYQEWINVGMALKAEGYDWNVWDDWSKNDSRYKPGECEKKWRTLQGLPTHHWRTIIQMAKDRGYVSFPLMAMDV